MGQNRLKHAEFFFVSQMISQVFVALGMYNFGFCFPSRVDQSRECNFHVAKAGEKKNIEIA